MAENSPTVFSKGGRLPFSRSICPCFQVLNFGNNILQATHGRKVKLIDTHINQGPHLRHVMRKAALRRGACGMSIFMIRVGNDIRNGTDA